MQSYFRNTLYLKVLLLLLSTVTLFNCAAGTTTNIPKPVEVSQKHFRIIKTSDSTDISMLDLFYNITEADVVIIGEQHNDPVAHHIELEVLKGITRLRGTAVVSMEMFERDVQHIVDEYLRDEISEQFLIEDGRAWENYETDYKPIIEFAKSNQLLVIAANAPRRYVRIVSSKGIDALDNIRPESLKYLAPLPLKFPNTSTYRDKFFELLQQPVEDETTSPHGGHMPESVLIRIFQAQVLRDATMAYSIGQFYRENPQIPIVQFNGSFHSDHYMGLVGHLKRDYKEMNIITLTVIPTSNFPMIDLKEIVGIADFVIISDKSLQNAHRN